jgi:large subunit ribosomal protein L10
LPITRGRKEELVAQYVDLLDQSNGFIIVDFKGLPVTRIDELRDKVREAQGKYLVAKNTLFTKALQQKGWPVPDDILTGPSAVVFGLENLPGVAKAVLDFSGAADLENKFAINGGVMTGKILSAKEVDAVSKLPTLDELRAQLVGLIVQPATGLVSVINSATGQVVNVIQAYLDEKQPKEGAA